MEKAQAAERAIEIVARDSADFAFRSCWECNPSHEHLKTSEELIRCFDCGRLYYSGHDVTRQIIGYLTKKTEN